MKTAERIRTRMGKRGTLVIAASLRKIYGFEDGADVVQEATPEGVLIRPAQPPFRFGSAVRVKYFGRTIGGVQIILPRMLAVELTES